MIFERMVAFMEITAEKTLTDIVLEIRENFKKNNGRLLTVEEAIQITDEARKSARKDTEILHEKN